jgi:predicted nucleic acid-binding protein
VIVLDASVVVEFLLGEPFNAIGSGLADRLEQRLEPLGAPHLIDAEVGQTLRRFERRGELTAIQARGAITDLSALPVARYPHGVLLDRAFDLRANVTVYDALYLALTETVEGELLTADAALADVPGCSARVTVLRA